MHGYVFALGPCLVCGALFTFDPDLVPSHPWPLPDGPRRPICRGCIDLLNERRRARGAPAWPIPAGAYPAEGEGAGRGDQ